MNNKDDKDLEYNEGCCESGCGCGHDHDHGDEGRDVMYLTLEDDTELECDVLGVFEVDEQEYIALVPVGDEEVLLYKYQDLGEDFDLLPIEDEEEFEVVSEAFYTLFSDDEDIDFEDDEEDEE